MALALLHNRDQVLWRHAHMYWSQDTATQMLSSSSATLLHKNVGNSKDIDWVAILEGHRKQLECIENFSILGVGNIRAHSYLETILVAPTKTLSQLFFNTMQEHMDSLNYCVFQWCCGKNWLVTGKRILLKRGCKKEKSSHTYMTKYLICLASSLKKSPYFITGSCFVCRIDQNQSSNWRINLISLQICRNSFFFYSWCSWKLHEYVSSKNSFYPSGALNEIP